MTAAVDFATIMRLQIRENLSVSFIEASALCLQANKCQRQTGNCKLPTETANSKPKLELRRCPKCKANKWPARTNKLSS